jgi:Na+-translocating ferredoxin:NAD+ oxidoreductase RNF subunit RnfB
MFKIDKEKCIGCAICIDYCPIGAIIMKDDKAEINNQCTDCGDCVQACPQGAISPINESQPRFFSHDKDKMYPGFTFNRRGRGLGRGMGRGFGGGQRNGRGRGGRGRWR